MVTSKGIEEAVRKVDSDIQLTDTQTKCIDEIVRREKNLFATLPTGKLIILMR